MSMAIVIGLWLTVEPANDGARTLQLVLAAVAVAGTTVSIRWPVLAMIVTGVATGTAWVLGLTADPFLLTAFGVFALAERQGERRIPLRMLGGALIVALVTLGLSAEGLEDRFRALLLSAVVLTVAWVLGVRTRQVTLEAAARSRADERLRLVRDVHDILSHSLATIGVRAGVAAHVATLGEAELREVLRDVEAGARDSLAELTGVLRRERADDRFAPASGPVVELSAALADVARTAERTGMRTHLNVTGNVDDLPAALSTTVQRLAQESVTNAARHAEAASLRISVSVLTDRVDLEVQDDGLGATAGLRSGHGLTGMRERVALVGGTLRIHPGPPGFTVSASIPLAVSVGRGTSV